MRYKGHRGTGIGNHGTQIAIRRSNDAHVNTPISMRARPAPDLALLQRAQKFRLHGHIEFSNLIKEKVGPRSAILEEPFFLRPWAPVNEPFS